MSGCVLEVAALTDVGRVRGFNEDTVVADRQAGIALVADGMGGHRAGAVASSMARDILLRGMRRRRWRTPPARAVAQALEQANDQIYRAGQEDAPCRGMGTTLAMMLFHGKGVTLAHVGDSRIYRLRAGRLAQLTRDDSLVDDQVSAGLISADQAGSSHNRHLVTRALGVDAHVDVHVQETDVRPGDIFIASSDGLHDIVRHEDIELIVATLQMNLTLAAHHLVQLANDLGGFDNISVALVKAGEAPAANGWLARLFGRRY
jgi:serine/threonine protein phosphatase PrpC